MEETINFIFGGVDGTGVWSDKEYEDTFAQSHVNALYQGWQEGPKEYRRGPVVLDNRLDISTREQANRIFDFVTAHWRNAGKKAVFLAGYSRGGAAVIETAMWLKQENIPVECLILFDPVDRTGGVGLPWRDTPIVDTVKHLIYAQRDPTTKSRPNFGNCGTEIADRSKTKYSYKMFYGTHAAIGGMPYTQPVNGYIHEPARAPTLDTKVRVIEDKRASISVKLWAFELIFEAIYNCKQRLSTPSVQPNVSPSVGGQIPGQPGIGIPANMCQQRVYIVQQGDWLSKIALKYYGDAMKYKIIHQANLNVIGQNPDIIKPGQRLIIP